MAQTAKVKGIGNGYCRVVAEVEDLLDLAVQLKQRTFYCVGFARQLIGVVVCVPEQFR